MSTFIYKGVSLEAVQSDITKQSVDVIVNAANSSLLGGGGVDGAIHRAAGPTLLDACRDIRNAQGKCNTGESVVTHAGELDAKHVFHTVGPVWQGGTEGEYILLESCYRTCLDLAKDNGMSSIAFPAISTGAYKFPFDEASYIAIRAAVLFLDETPEHSLKTIRYVIFSDGDFERFSAAFRDVTMTMTGTP